MNASTGGAQSDTREPVYVHWIEKIGEDCKDIERGLQIACGAALLALVALLSTVWTDFDTPPFNLRLVVIEALAAFGYAFALVLLATMTRVLVKVINQLGDATDFALLKRVVQVRTYRPRVGLIVTPFFWLLRNGEMFIWTVFIVLSVMQFVDAGTGLLRGLLEATEKEVDRAGVSIREKQEEQDRRISELERAMEINQGYHRGTN